VPVAAFEFGSASPQAASINSRPVDNRIRSGVGSGVRNMDLCPCSVALGQSARAAALPPNERIQYG